MRKWVSIRDDISDVGGDALKTAESVYLRIYGEVRRRPGLTKQEDQGGLYMAHIRSPIAGSSVLLVQSDGTVDGILLS